MKRGINICLFLFLPLAVYARPFPESFCVFRDAVYSQSKGLLETMRLYTQAKQDIEKTLNGAEMYLALARSEYLIGLSFRADKRNSEAAAFFEQGIAYAEEALELSPSSEGYRLLGTNIAFLCEIKRSYGLKNFGRIEESAKKALELDPGNLPARYLIAAQYVAAPWPLGNAKRGAALLAEIAGQNIVNMDKEDLFNLYLMLEAASLKLKKNQEARIWHERAAALYPTNNFISLLVK